MFPAQMELSDKKASLYYPCDSLFQAQSLQVIIVMFPSQMELLDKTASVIFNWDHLFQAHDVIVVISPFTDGPFRKRVSVC